MALKLTKQMQQSNIFLNVRKFKDNVFKNNGMQNILQYQK